MSYVKSDQTVLIVDDIPENLKLLVEILRPLYKIAVATNGPDTLRIAQSNYPPDLILLDIMMPGMDGYEVCQHLKSDPVSKDIPIIFLTAMTQDQDETKGFTIGAVDYVTKPFKPMVVISRIRTHMELKRQRALLEEQTRQYNEALEELDRSNRFIRQTFGRYLSDDIVKNILETPDGLNLGGEKRELTLLISDIRGFTRICEQLPPEQVVDIINIYLEVMTEVILKYHGTIDEFIGDSILVIFGAPLLMEDDAQRAVACALEMQLAMNEVNERCGEKGYPELHQGIGINTGRAVVGNIGSRKRIKYGVVGSNVNLAARIQSYTLGGQVFVSENTFNACDPLLRIDDYIEILTKGIKDPIKIYDVGGIAGDFNVHLPEKDKILPMELEKPLDIRFSIILDHQVIGESCQGKFTRINNHMAEVKAERGFRRFTDVIITLFDQEGKEISTQLYAKVTNSLSDSPPTFQVNFTSVPDNAREFLKNVID